VDGSRGRYRHPSVMQSRLSRSRHASRRHRASCSNQIG
jgi:hypothetical protein